VKELTLVGIAAAVATLAGYTTGLLSVLGVRYLDGIWGVGQVDTLPDQGLHR
jgi:hypothetical protein